MKNLLIAILIPVVFQIYNVRAQGPEVCQREAIVYCDFYKDFFDVMWNDSVSSIFEKAAYQKLAELFTRENFQLMPPQPLDFANEPENEYQFEVKYKGVTNFSDLPNPKLTLRLEFDKGSYWDLVNFWEVTEPGDTVGTSWQSLLIKLEQSVRNGPDIIKLIKEYEKRPVNLEIEMDKEVLDPGEEIDIYVTNWIDERKNVSEPFNRIVVHAEEGEIINGAVTDFGPDYYAFLTERGLVELQYKAPDDCENLKEKITIYNSCDVLPEQRYFMNRTKQKKELKEQGIDINCFDATIKINKKYKKTFNSRNSDDSFSGSCKTHLEEEHTINESIEATVNLALKLETVQDMPIFNQTWEYYKPATVTLSNFTYNSKEHKYNASNNSGADCANVSHETNVDFDRNAENYELEGQASVTQTHWMLVIDNETGEAVKLIPSGYGISYKINELEKLNSVINSDDGPQRDSKTSTRKREKSFKLGPVGEEIADPTIKSSNTWMQDYLKRQGVELPAGVEIPSPSNEETIKEIHPDILVQSGDGITSFGGRGERRIETEIEYGIQEENMYYTWQMTRRKKSQ